MPEVNQEMMSLKPRILCLHGGYQTGAIMSNKIAGARRKLERFYELDFLDGPFSVQWQGQGATTTTSSSGENKSPPQLAWWTRNENKKPVGVEEGIDYVLEYAKDRNYDALLGFSQGGTLATMLSLTGKLKTVKAVVSAGSPYVEDAFVGLSRNDIPDQEHEGIQIPKFHFAGETDGIVSIESTEKLSEVGGNGRVVVHTKGHLFPTQAVHVNAMMDFLATHLLEKPER